MDSFPHFTDEAPGAHQVKSSVQSPTTGEWQGHSGAEVWWLKSYILDFRQHVTSLPPP